LLIAQIGSVQIFQGGIVGEIFKLRNIVAHFQEHQEIEKDISFIDFIAMHYGESSMHRGAHTHNKPFPFHKYSGSANFFAAVLPVFGTTENKFYNSQNLIHGVLVSENRIDSFNGDVWLPPKLG
jgi:hypothetical protein